MKLAVTKLSKPDWRNKQADTHTHTLTIIVVLTKLKKCCYNPEVIKTQMN